MTQKNKKQNAVIVVGLVLIALVFVFTFLRSLSEKKQNEININKETKNYPEITSNDLKKKISNNEIVQLLDIRTSDEYQLEHIPNSTNADISYLPSDIDPRKITIIIGNYDAQKDSDIFFEKLKKEKFNDIFILSGGFSAWKKSGGNTISIGNPNSFSDQSKVRYINPEDLKKIIDDKDYPRYVLDIRPKNSFSEEHLPEATNIPLDELEKTTGKIPLEKEIFVYGNTNLQGFQGGVRLFDLGFFSVKILSGGIEEWKTKGFETIK